MTKPAEPVSFPPSPRPPVGGQPSVQPVKLPAAEQVSVKMVLLDQIGEDIGRQRTEVTKMKDQVLKVTGWDEDVESARVSERFADVMRNAFGKLKQNRTLSYLQAARIAAGREELPVREDHLRDVREEVSGMKDILGLMAGQLGELTARTESLETTLSSPETPRWMEMKLLQMEEAQIRMQEAQIRMERKVDALLTYAGISSDS